MKDKVFMQLGMGPINMIHIRNINVWNYAQHHREGTNYYYIITISLGCCNNCSSTTVIYMLSSSFTPPTLFVTPFPLVRDLRFFGLLTQREPELGAEEMMGRSGLNI